MTPRVIRVLVVLLALTALATAAVEALNWWLAEEAGYALFVRTTWALLRTLGFLVLIWQVRRGRASAPPLAVILSVTSLFALARLVVPRQGPPSLWGLVGFTAVAALCGAVLVLMYHSPAVVGFLTQPRKGIVFTRKGIDWGPVRSKRPPAPGWLLTTRVAALSYSPLMLVACVVAFGLVFDGDLASGPVIGMWFLAALVVSYAMLVVTGFLMRQKPWARTGLVWLTAMVLVIHLPLCWLLLGVDGLVRDGGPLVAAAALALFGLWRSASKTGSTYQSRT
ncbi:hypothetical protein Rhe02_14470 [Rhizocola hellebori]|uniref:Uncharacterized protein n=1 Tax=Rhizocola hellebori TaxID=1392758 RepID=A0A8J3Q536_9ACTN|nr:hypothetical protein [Rhizocola hellebori]GIH03380.1 hypothetical protein Rhe02_14470 [Rhizocola hellebori]